MPQPLLFHRLFPVLRLIILALFRPDSSHMPDPDGATFFTGDLLIQRIQLSFRPVPLCPLLISPCVITNFSCSARIPLQWVFRFCFIS
ncbi:hypothetical protein MTP19_13275 [Escherichia coli]|nr:hypothetical protein MTP19_13275 [Escherichia coli]